MRTIDLTDFSEDMSRSPVWPTPTKQELSQSQSIPYASPSWTRSLQTPTQNQYTALRTIDLTDFSEDMSRSPVWSTPTKQELSQSISYASPPWTRSLQTSTHNQPRTGMI